MRVLFMLAMLKLDTIGFPFPSLITLSGPDVTLRWAQTPKTAD
jgi:hypothetical protein